MKPSVVVDCTTAQGRFDEILDECALRGTVFCIYLDGKPMAKMMPVSADDELKTGES